MKYIHAAQMNSSHSCQSQNKLFVIPKYAILLVGEKALFNRTSLRVLRYLQFPIIVCFTVRNSVVLNEMVQSYCDYS